MNLLNEPEVHPYVLPKLQCLKSVAGFGAEGLPSCGSLMNLLQGLSGPCHVVFQELNKSQLS
jgi:hypothetical protein